MAVSRQKGKTCLYYSKTQVRVPRYVEVLGYAEAGEIFSSLGKFQKEVVIKVVLYLWIRFGCVRMGKYGERKQHWLS